MIVHVEEISYKKNKVPLLCICVAQKRGNRYYLLRYALRNISQSLFFHCESL